MKRLIVYPHGLGDCILATPAIRAYKKLTGDFVGFAMLERFKSSKLFDANPYVDELVYTKDAWNDFPSFPQGCSAILAAMGNVAKERGYDKVTFIQHSRDKSKILDCFDILGIPHEGQDLHTEVYITDKDREESSKYAPAGDYGFIHGSSPSVPPKDFPPGWGRAWLSKERGLDKFVEVGVDFTPTEININVQFSVMERAKAVCLIDSAFYHGCLAMDKRVDLAYFNRGGSVYNRVRHLHETDEHIIYQLPDVAL